MTRPQGHQPTKEPAGGGSEDNGNVHVENRPEWKKRPDQYPDTKKTPAAGTGKA